MTAPIHLSDRAVLAVYGSDAESFLQGLITNDVNALAEGRAMYAALLTPQGKILFDFIVLRQGGTFLLDCCAATADALCKRLLLYRLRSKVSIERRDGLAVMAAPEGTSLPFSAWADPRLAALGQRAIMSRADLPASTAGIDTYLAHRLDCGVPEGADFGQDRLFALDGDLDELHAVSFEKGCYVGQELTARMKHRGTARKRVLAITTADGSPLAAPETPLTAGARELGAVLSTYGARGFALIRLDRLAESDASEITVAESSVRITRPSWLSA